MTPGDKTTREFLQSALNDEAAAALLAGSRNSAGRAVLHEVLAAGWYSLVPALLRAGADPSGADDTGASALSFALEKFPDRAPLQALLDGGLSPDTRFPAGGPTLLQRAIVEKDPARVAYLVSQGASASLTTLTGDEASKDPAEGKNAYHYAAQATPEIMGLLLEQPERAAAAAFFTEKRAPMSALRLALRAGDRAMTTLLLDHGIDVNETDNNGETPLHFVLGHRRSREETMPLVRLLLGAGADIDRKAANFWGETPLFSAVRDSFTEGALLLLDLGCDAAAKNHLGETLLHLAAKTYNAEIVRRLIGGGASLEETNRIGRTALHIAARENRLEVVKTLLEAGADPFARDKSGQTPLDLCPADFQKATHRVILQKQMEVEARRMTRPLTYAARVREQKNRLPGAKNRSFRPSGNRR